jgi:phosphohistidine phosphatase
MIVYFMRHGKAEDYSEDDESRALTAEGIRKTEDATHALKLLKAQPSAILASPRKRAQQTAVIIAKAYDLSVQTRLQLDFEFTLALLREVLSDEQLGDEVLLVGHNPSISQVIGEVCGVRVEMKKGGIAAVNLPATSPQHGHLLWLATPAMLSAIK